MGRRRLIFVLLSSVALADFGRMDAIAQEAEVWLDVGPLEAEPTFVAVRPVVEVSGLDGTPFLLSMTLEVEYDPSLFEYRAANLADLADFLDEWAVSCQEKTGSRSECSSAYPYVSNHSRVKSRPRPAIRVDVYSNPGYDPKLGAPGIRLAGDSVALSVFAFRPRESSGDGVEPYDTFLLKPQSATVSLYGGPAPDGSINPYVDCTVESNECRLIFTNPPSVE
jgi:hypothetical protein